MESNKNHVPNHQSVMSFLMVYDNDFLIEIYVWSGDFLAIFASIYTINHLENYKRQWEGFSHILCKIKT
jgi:hypothetical protein